MPDFDTILQIFGVNGTAQLRVQEAKSAPGEIAVVARHSGSEVVVILNRSEARYIADRLVYLADRLDKKAKDKRPCGECGK